MQARPEKRLKLLIVTSVLDLRLPYGGANIWWHLFSALVEQGVDLVVSVYQGRTIPSPYWESHENPCYWEGAVFAGLKKWAQRLPLNRKSERRSRRNLSDRSVLAMTHMWVRPRWRRHLFRIISSNPDLDAVLLFNLPLNQLSGIPAAIRARFGLPVVFYDTDLPVSLPSSHGFSSGFNIYPGANLGEYDLVLSPSLGGIDELKKMGASRAKDLLFAANPAVFSPAPALQKDIDVFFYGFGTDGRRDWMDRMLAEPSRQMPKSRFVVRGENIRMDMGNVEILKNIQVSRLRELCGRSRINVNIIREGHAAFYGSSTTRPFELAAMGCCMVCSPYPGLEEWFDVGKEAFMIEDPGEAVPLYRWLLAREKVRRETGLRARERVLKEHTYRHRAGQLVRIIRELLR